MVSIGTVPTVYALKDLAGDVPNSRYSDMQSLCFASYMYLPRYLTPFFLGGGDSLIVLSLSRL